MRKKILFVSLLLFSFISYCQTNKLLFEYDLAGNQKKRSLCLNCPSSLGKNVETKEISELKEEDLIKFSDEDVISYYPNPVKEELYLKWQLMEENYVKSIEVFSILGQLLASYQFNSNINSQNIPFQNYPEGIYAVILHYNNGDQKSVKIIKR